MNLKDLKISIISNLSDDLLSTKYQQIKKSSQFKLPRTFGHCYVASEAAYFLLGGKKGGWKPYYIKYLGCPHWFLKHDSGAILDLTSEQFNSPINYNLAVGKGFLTKNPSKRTLKLIRKIEEFNTCLF